MRNSEAETVTDAFRAAFQARYRVACSLIVSPMQFMLLDQHLEAHGVDALLDAVPAYFESQDSYVQKARHPLSLWLRDPLKYLAVVEESHGGAVCIHRPMCSSTSACVLRIINEARAERGASPLEGRR